MFFFSFDDRNPIPYEDVSHLTIPFVTNGMIDLI